jgi:hypothetical protein
MYNLWLLNPVFYLPGYSECRTPFNGQDLNFALFDEMVVKMKMSSTGHCVRPGICHIHIIFILSEVSEGKYLTQDPADLEPPTYPTPRPPVLYPSERRTV